MMKYNIEYRLRLKIHKSDSTPNSVTGIVYCIRATHRPTSHRSILTGFVSADPNFVLNLDTVLLMLNDEVRREINTEIENVLMLDLKEVKSCQKD